MSGTYEAPDMAAMMRRVTRALVRRAEDGDLEALTALVDVEAAVHAATRDAAVALHDGPFAYSWNEIARELGITRQAARMYGARDSQEAAS